MFVVLMFVNCCIRRLLIIINYFKLLLLSISRFENLLFFTSFCTLRLNRLLGLPDCLPKESRTCALRRILFCVDFLVRTEHILAGWSSVALLLLSNFIGIARPHRYNILRYGLHIVLRRLRFILVEKAWHLCLRIPLAVFLHHGLYCFSVLSFLTLFFVEFLLYDRELFEDALHLFQEGHRDLSLLVILTLIYHTILLKLLQEFGMLELNFHQIFKFLSRACELARRVSPVIEFTSYWCALPELALSHRWTYAWC